MFFLSTQTTHSISNNGSLKVASLAHFSFCTADKLCSTRPSSRKRRLLLETLEDRRLLATLNVTATGSTIYEEGTPTNQVDYGLALTGAGNWLSTKVVITGQVDAYTADDLASSLSEIGNPTYQRREFQIGSKNSLRLAATQDELISIASIAPAYSNPYYDTKDYANDPISLAFTVTYTDPGSSVVRTLTRTRSLTIVDTDVQPTTEYVTLSTPDATANEPHNTYYIPELPHKSSPVGWVATRTCLPISRIVESPMVLLPERRSQVSIASFQTQQS